MSWRFNRQYSQVLDEAGGVVADCLPEHGDAIAALPGLLKACESLLELEVMDYEQHGPETQKRIRHAVAALENAVEQAKGES